MSDIFGTVTLGVGETIAAGTVIGGLEMLDRQVSGKKRKKQADPWAEFEKSRPRSYQKRSRRRK